VSNTLILDGSVMCTALLQSSCVYWIVSLTVPLYIIPLIGHCDLSLAMVGGLPSSSQ
jgi:hypothetical protein